VKIGDTVSLRVTTPAGPTEVVGALVAATAGSMTVRRRDGELVEVDVTSVTAGRVVPPGPAVRISVDELERIAAAGWRAAETEALGGWLLRAGGGFTGRANSALVLGDPGVAVGRALATVEEWYAERGLPPRLQIPSGQSPAGLEPMLSSAGWELSATVHVMTAEVGHVLRAGGDNGPDVRLDEAPDGEWLAAYRREGGEALPPAARAILTNHANVVFASVRDEARRCVAVARATVDGRWAGLFAVEVAPDGRRAGLGAAVSVAALRWATRHGARRAYLQTAADNVPAVSLFRRMGFEVHHDYRYAQRNLA
jgi:ribosomal protein S18 acetylase RimI-like enzyme